MNHRRVLSFALLALLALLPMQASACMPGLREAFYTCDDGVCPEGFFCAPDALCHHEPLAIYADCNVDDQCASGDCDTGFDATNDDPAQCSMSCSDDTDCPDSGEAQGRCAEGQCLLGCQMDAECPENVDCLVIPMTQGVKACFHLVDPDYASVLACGGQRPQCPKGLACVMNATHGTVGVCAWPCAMASDSCPYDGECTALTGATFPATCLTPCVMDQECREGLKCLAYPNAAGPKHCVPPLWP